MINQTNVQMDQKVPLETLELSNPGIGDSSFIYRDRSLRHGLKKFPESSYELTLAPSNGEIMCCGGYEYIIKIFAQHEEIKQLIEDWYKGKLEEGPPSPPSNEKSNFDWFNEIAEPLTKDDLY
jgi:hypothetical protein